jgi:mRNA interferase RelE/StbE
LSYNLFIEKSAQKNLAKIPSSDRTKIIKAIYRLKNTPHPVGSKKLSGREAWRIRIGNYRVIYEINDDQLIILILKVGHRQSAYK